MSKTAIRITPFGGFDIPGLECWLAAMAAKGLRFTMTTGPLSFFDRDEARTVQVHLEPIQGSTDEDPELNAIYEKAGCSCWPTSCCWGSTGRVRPGRLTCGGSGITRWRPCPTAPRSPSCWPGWAFCSLTCPICWGCYT